MLLFRGSPFHGIRDPKVTLDPQSPKDVFETFGGDVSHVAGDHPEFNGIKWARSGCCGRHENLPECERDVRDIDRVW